MKILATGNIVVEQSTQRGIVVIGSSHAGGIALMADGNILINGRLKANNANAQASGGEISLAARLHVDGAACEHGDISG